MGMRDTGKKAIIVILSAPSGGGKSSVARALISKDPRLALSISATTRKPRPGDEDGVQYFFKSHDEFQEMIDKGQFLEYTEIYGNFYGTLKKYVEDTLAKGMDILFDIDIHGAKKMKQEAPYHVVSIFLLPPSLEILRQRLEKRGQDDQVSIEHRMGKAAAEMENAKYYDYAVINENFDETVRKIMEIITTERSKS
jgi:guanylate kinase